MLESVEKLRKTADECTQIAGVKDKFETVWITKKAFINMLDEVEQEVAERYIEGPKGSDGRSVRYGGYVKVYPYDGSKRKVKALRCSGFGWKAIFEDGDEESMYRVVSCEPPTVEDVLREFTDAILEWAGKSGTVAETGTWSDVASEYAERLQLKEDE